jgi:hypothetical protein
MALDGNQLRSYVLDKDRNPQDKFKDLWEYYFSRLLVYIASFKGILPLLQNYRPGDLGKKTIKNRRVRLGEIGLAACFIISISISVFLKKRLIELNMDI